MVPATPDEPLGPWGKLSVLSVCTARGRGEFGQLKGGKKITFEAPGLAHWAGTQVWQQKRGDANWTATREESFLQPRVSPLSTAWAHPPESPQPSLDLLPPTPIKQPQDSLGLLL